jgi:hypothetical protein
MLQHATSGVGMSRHGGKHAATVIAAAGVTATTVMLAAPTKCSAGAPPCTISRPTVSYTVWTETELTAPTKHGKLKRRRGGGGSGGDDNGDDAAGSGGNFFDGFDGGDGGDGNGGGDNGGDWSNNNNNNNFRGGNGGNGGNGGGGEDWWGDGSWMDGSSGSGMAADGNLLFAWQTLCGVAFAGSVQHIVEKGMQSRVAWPSDGGDAENATAAAAGGTGVCAIGPVSGMEVAAAAAGRLCLASMTTAHLARHQPVLTMSISA